jgi:uroporphyrinogen-III decarboxylase
MTCLERCQCAVRRGVPDRVPVVPLIISHAVKQAGARFSQYNQRPDLIASVQAEAKVAARMGLLPEATRGARRMLGNECFIKTNFDQGPFSRAGAHAVTFGDAVAGLVSREDFIKFEFPALKEVVGRLLAGSPELVYRQSRELMRSAGPGGFILSSGCEVPRDTPPENIHAMVRAARDGEAS